jgi:hypothetical protein
MTFPQPPLQPRPGLHGEWDKFVGPGQTQSEFWLLLLPAITAAIAAPLYAARANPAFSMIQLSLASLLAFDLVGGVLTNATNTAKRWYHRPGQGWRQHMGFLALHFLQPLVVAIFFRATDLFFFLMVYGFLILAGLVITQVRWHLQRPAAMLFYLGAILLNTYVLTPTRGLEWFLPVFTLKLLLSHLVKETPVSEEQG